MSFMSRALYGLGEASSNLANKYIDESLAQERAAALAAIQVQTAQTIREQSDAFNNDPMRIARDRGNKVADIEAEGGARNKVQLEGLRAQETDPALNKARVDNKAAEAGAVTKATAEAQVAAELKRITNPEYISAERKLALARHIESAGSIAQAQLAQFQLGQAKNMADLRQQLAEAQTTGNKEAADDIQAQLDALDGKGGKVDKFYQIAERAMAGTASANKVLSDPLATQDAKEEAQRQIRQSNVLIESAAKRAGVDLSAARYAPPPQAAIDALKKNPDKAADYDAKFGPGASAKVLGSSPQAAKPAPLMQQAMTPSDQQGLERLTQAGAAKGYTRRGNMFQQGGTGPLLSPAEMAKELGLVW